MWEEKLFLFLLSLSNTSSAAVLTLLSPIEVDEVHIAFIIRRPLLIVIDAWLTITVGICSYSSVCIKWTFILLFRIFEISVRGRLIEGILLAHLGIQTILLVCRENLFRWYTFYIFCLYLGKARFTSWRVSSTCGTWLVLSSTHINTPPFVCEFHFDRACFSHKTSAWLKWARLVDTLSTIRWLLLVGSVEVLDCFCM